MDGRSVPVLRPLNVPLRCRGGGEGGGGNVVMRIRTQQQLFEQNRIRVSFPISLPRLPRAEK